MGRTPRKGDTPEAKVARVNELIAAVEALQVGNYHELSTEVLRTLHGGTATIPKKLWGYIRAELENRIDEAECAKNRLAALLSSRAPVAAGGEPLGDACCVVNVQLPSSVVLSHKHQQMLADLEAMKQELRQRRLAQQAAGASSEAASTQQVEESVCAARRLAGSYGQLAAVGPGSVVDPALQDQLAQLVASIQGAIESHPELDDSAKASLLLELARLRSLVEERQHGLWLAAQTREVLEEALDLLAALCGRAARSQEQLAAAEQQASQASGASDRLRERNCSLSHRLHVLQRDNETLLGLLAETKEYSELMAGLRAQAAAGDAGGAGGAALLTLEEVLSGRGDLEGIYPARRRRTKGPYAGPVEDASAAAAGGTGAVHTRQLPPLLPLSTTNLSSISEHEEYRGGVPQLGSDGDAAGGCGGQALGTARYSELSTPGSLGPADAAAAAQQVDGRSAPFSQQFNLLYGADLAAEGDGEAGDGWDGTYHWVPKEAVQLLARGMPSMVPVERFSALLLQLNSAWRKQLKGAAWGVGPQSGGSEDGGGVAATAGSLPSSPGKTLTPGGRRDALASDLSRELASAMSSFFYDTDRAAAAAAAASPGNMPAASGSPHAPYWNSSFGGSEMSSLRSMSGAGAAAGHGGMSSPGGGGLVPGPYFGFMHQSSGASLGGAALPPGYMMGPGGTLVPAVLPPPGTASGLSPYSSAGGASLQQQPSEAVGQTTIKPELSSVHVQTDSLPSDPLRPSSSRLVTHRYPSPSRSVDGRSPLLMDNQRPGTASALLRSRAGTPTKTAAGPGPLEWEPPSTLSELPRAMSALHASESQRGVRSPLGGTRRAKTAVPSNRPRGGGGGGDDEGLDARGARHRLSSSVVLTRSGRAVRFRRRYTDEAGGRDSDSDDGGNNGGGLVGRETSISELREAAARLTPRSSAGGAPPQPAQAEDSSLGGGGGGSADKKAAVARTLDMSAAAADDSGTARRSSGGGSSVAKEFASMLGDGGASDGTLSVGRRTTLDSVLAAATADEANLGQSASLAAVSTPTGAATEAQGSKEAHASRSDGGGSSSARRDDAAGADDGAVATSPSVAIGTQWDEAEAEAAVQRLLADGSSAEAARNNSSAADFGRSEAHDGDGAGAGSSDNNDDGPSSQHTASVGLAGWEPSGAAASPRSGSRKGAGQQKQRSASGSPVKHRGDMGQLYKQAADEHMTARRRHGGASSLGGSPDRLPPGAPLPAPVGLYSPAQRKEDYVAIAKKYEMYGGLRGQLSGAAAAGRFSKLPDNQSEAWPQRSLIPKEELKLPGEKDEREAALVAEKRTELARQRMELNKARNSVAGSMASSRRTSFSGMTIGAALLTPVPIGGGGLGSGANTHRSRTSSVAGGLDIGRMEDVAGAPSSYRAAAPPAGMAGVALAATSATASPRYALAPKPPKPPGAKSSAASSGTPSPTKSAAAPSAAPGDPSAASPASARRLSGQSGAAAPALSPQAADHLDEYLLPRPSLSAAAKRRSAEQQQQQEEEEEEEGEEEALGSAATQQQQQSPRGPEGGDGAAEPQAGIAFSDVTEPQVQPGPPPPPDVASSRGGSLEAAEASALQLPALELPPGEPISSAEPSPTGDGGSNGGSDSDDEEMRAELHSAVSTIFGVPRDRWQEVHFTGKPRMTGVEPDGYSDSDGGCGSDDEQGGRGAAGNRYSSPWHKVRPTRQSDYGDAAASKAKALGLVVGSGRSAEEAASGVDGDAGTPSTMAPGARVLSMTGGVEHKRGSATNSKRPSMAGAPIEEAEEESSRGGGVATVSVAVGGSQSYVEGVSIGTDAEDLAASGTSTTAGHSVGTDMGQLPPLGAGEGGSPTPFKGRVSSSSSIASAATERTSVGTYAALDDYSRQFRGVTGSTRPGSRSEPHLHMAYLGRDGKVQIRLAQYAKRSSDAGESAGPSSSLASELVQKYRQAREMFSPPPPGSSSPVSHAANKSWRP